MGAAAPESERHSSGAICIPLIILMAILIPIYMLVGTIMSEPSIYIQDLYVPALVPELNKTTSFNASVFIEFKFERAWTSTSPSYKDLRMTLYYGELQKNSSLGTHMVPGFSMERRRRVHTRAAMEAVGMPWQEAIRATSGGNVVAMVVELVVDESSMNGVARARVWVDNSGHMVPMNPIQLF